MSVPANTRFKQLGTLMPLLRSALFGTGVPESIVCACLVVELLAHWLSLQVQVKVPMLPCHAHVLSHALVFDLLTLNQQGSPSANPSFCRW
jgi:hypothetical protein